MTLTPAEKAELKAAAELFGELIVSQTTTKDLLKYVAVAGPTAILDLLSEVEILRGALERIISIEDSAVIQARAALGESHE